MKKVLFMIPTLGHGGAEKVLVNLINHMNYNDFQVTVMTLYDEGVNKQFLSNKIIYKSCFRKAIPGAGHLLKVFSPSFLYRHLVKQNYDIVISYLEGQTARIVSGCENPNIKKVCWIHRTMNDLKDSSRMFRNSDEAIKCYGDFDYIVSVSEDVQEAFENVFHQNHNQIVLYNTNQSDLIHEKAHEAVDTTLFLPGEIKLCGMGTLIPVKGFERLISTHKRLREQNMPVHTYILGEGPEKEKLEEMIRNDNLEQTITLLGYQENPYKYLSRCDLFVCSSFSEGFSTAATEALICGIPVVTTKVSGMNELLGNNEYGVITDNNESSLYDAVYKVLSEERLLKYYAEKAVQRGKEFSTDYTVKAVENFLNNL